MKNTITVLLPAYNSSATVELAIRSILSQNYPHFEILVINDGSTDTTLDIISNIKDDRLTIVSNKQNMGLIFTLNRGLNLSRGTYVARMDSDDIALPGRLAAQAALMDSQPEIGACGMSIETFGSGPPRVIRYPVGPRDVRCHVLGYTPMAHPTVMFRKSLLDSHGLRYDPSFPHAEDYDLLERASRCFEMANISGVGLRYRIHPGQVTKEHGETMANSVARIRARALSRLDPGSGDLCDPDMISIFFNTERTLNIQEASRAGEWMRSIIRLNQRTECFPAEALKQFLAARWLNVCHRTPGGGLALARLHGSASIELGEAWSCLDNIKLFAKRLITQA